MEITKREIQHDPLRICLVVIKGECKNDSDAKALEHDFKAIRTSGIVHVVIDASAMAYAVPACLGKLAYFATTFREKGGDVRLVVRPKQKLLVELGITHLDSFLKVYETKEEAIKSFF